MSCFILNGCENGLVDKFRALFPFLEKLFDDGLRSLGFYIKPNKFHKVDWLWMVHKVEERISNWEN